MSNARNKITAPQLTGSALEEVRMIKFRLRTIRGKRAFADEEKLLDRRFHYLCIKGGRFFHYFDDIIEQAYRDVANRPYTRIFSDCYLFQ